MPGFFGKEVIEKIDDQLREIIHYFNLNTGCMNFDALFADNNVVILDIGLRNGGNYVPDLIKLSTGVDLTEAAVYSAFGVNFQIEQLHVENPKPVMTYILSSSSYGRFLGVHFSPEIHNNVKNSIIFAEFESEVKPFTRGDFALGVVFLEFDTINQMKKKWDNIENLIQVEVMPIEELEGTSINKIGYKRYKELVSPFLRKKIDTAIEEKREDVVRVLKRQFAWNSKEIDIDEKAVIKHYDASVDFEFEGQKLFGVERLYRRQLVVDITLKCAAHCRHCLRRNYEPFILSTDDLSRIARFIGKSDITTDVREILITGGDPFLVPKKLIHFLHELDRLVPFLETVRIASRLPIHQPDWINDNLLSILSMNYSFRVEVATQINHSVELFPEVRAVYLELRKHVSAIYNQTVLLDGVNNSITELLELFDNLRSLGIENHYLFHCVPIGGLDWLRTSLDETIELANCISSSGLISGRTKPQVAVMTDIGKITLYEGSIISRKENLVLLRSNYSLADRLAWNPSWKLPTTALVDKDGKLSVWYIDKKEN